MAQGDFSGWDGEAVAGEIKKGAPDIVVVGNANRKPIEAADFNCPKVEGLEKLGEVIRGI